MSNATAVPCFQPALLRFLAELADNNDRAWFEANKDRYEHEVREPVLGFVAAFGKPLATIGPCFVADPRPRGGSMFRIYRDVRFSRDKSPYKTSVGIQFRHREATRDVHAPGFYLHLQPGECFAGAGLWHPAGEALAAVRGAIDDQRRAWGDARESVEKGGFRLGGDSLKRAPKGYPPDHPLIEDLRRKDFVCLHDLGDDEVVAPGFLDHFAELCASTVPLMRFLTEAVGLSYDR